MQITAIEKDKRRMKTINKAAISITVIAAMTMCMSFAYAGIFESIGDALFVGTALTNPTDIIIGGACFQGNSTVNRLVTGFVSKPRLHYHYDETWGFVQVYPYNE